MIARRKRELRGRRKPARERVGFHPFLHLVVRPGIRSALVEEGDSDHSNIARVAVFLMCVRLPHRPKTERGHRIGALPKTFDDKLAVRLELGATARPAQDARKDAMAIGVMKRSVFIRGD